MVLLRMNNLTLKAKCEHWSGSDADFAYIVKEALNFIDPSSLAIEFDVATSTVQRWSIGTTAPLPRMQVMVVQFIYKHL